MSEAPDKDSKTEEATEKKRRDSIEKGKVPVSKELSVFLSLIGMLIVAGFLIGDSVARLTLTLQRMIDDPGGWSLENGPNAVLLLHAVVGESARFLGPLLLVLLLSGLAASFLQNAPRFVLNRIQPELSRISVSKGWKRTFGPQGQTEFAKSAFKFLGITLVAVLLLRSQQHVLVNAMFIDPSSIPDLVLTVAMHLLSAVSVATILLVAADLVWSRLHWERDLRMTKQEVKDEFKQAEGDPILKARRLSLARDRSRRRMLAAVPRATLVIVNPTHYAVALRYVREEGGAPLVLAKGQDFIALRIRGVAEANNIPVVEDKALARSLYESVEVDRLIPAEFYRAIAEIIFFLQSRQTSGTAKP
jgi:flagellar biosynthesis protein FlhB